MKEIFTSVKWKVTEKELMPTEIFMKVHGCKISHMALENFSKHQITLIRKESGNLVKLKTIGK